MKRKWCWGCVVVLGNTNILLHASKYAAAGLELLSRTKRKLYCHQEAWQGQSLDQYPLKRELGRDHWGRGEEGELDSCMLHLVSLGECMEYLHTYLLICPAHCHSLAEEILWMTLILFWTKDYFVEILSNAIPTETVD